MNPIIKTPREPYYAVIFTSQRTEGDNGYEKISDQLVSLISEYPGFLGAESVRGADGFGITVSYWDSLESAQKWGENESHKIARQWGREKWYQGYGLRFCVVQKDAFFNKNE